MLKKTLYVPLMVTLFFSNGYIYAQKNYPDSFYRNFDRYYSSGDFINAERCLLNSIESRDTHSNSYLTATYNNLGTLSYLLGRYDAALNYFSFAEALAAKQHQDTTLIADIYNNKARLYGIIREPEKAIDYLEQGLKIYLSVKNPDQSVLYRTSTVYNNLGLMYYQKADYPVSIEYLNKSRYLKLKYNLSEKALPFLNIAKTYVKINNPSKAEEFFLKGIASFTSEFGMDYYRLPELYFDYGLFLETIGKNKEAFEIYQKSLSICLKSYGTKHAFVSLAYKHIGDCYYSQSDYPTALAYYQKSLIAVVADFNNPDIYSNPLLNSALFNIRLLDNLKAKAQALERLAKQQDGKDLKLKNLRAGLGTIELALQLVGRIRNDYVSADSREYLAENEKETYIQGTRIAQDLYELTGNQQYLQRMYSIALSAKGALLRNAITENELLSTMGLPVALKQRRNSLLVDMASYSKLIQDEQQKTHADSQRVNLWKDALFEMNRTKERLDDTINKLFPQYQEILQKTEPLELAQIQSHLKSDETLVEYFISNQYSKGKRELFVYTVTKGKLQYYTQQVDSLFSRDVETIKLGTVQLQTPNNPAYDYRSYTQALFGMYKRLIRPIENQLAGTKLIVVPDEEIAYLPFDAFLKSPPDSNQFDYESLQYLIRTYTFSYGYASSLIFGQKGAQSMRSEVYSFSPDSSSELDSSMSNVTSLQATGKEIGSIYRWFRGEKFLGEQATESQFKHEIQHPAIFHLAMHSLPDSTNSKYSCLAFSSSNDTLNDGRLYNYEVSTSRISSPMVVLSACQTGSGVLYHGEGVMSLARGFILAGASSVVNTFWDVNDDASARIMIDFYRYLSQGKGKAEALRMAKLDYLKSTPPTFTNPYYWAAYEVMGDVSPVTHGKRTWLLVGLGVILILGVGAGLYLVRRRNLRT